MPQVPMPHGARRPALLPAVAIACLLAGCQSGGTPAPVAPVTVPPVAAAPPAASRISVTIAPASVAPGAVRTGTPTPAGITITVPPAATASLSLSAPGRYVAPCLPSPSPKQIGVQVTPGSGSAMVSWQSDGDSTVRSYRVSAISQRLVAGTQPPPPTATVARGSGCGPLRVTLGGLTRGAAYVFWLEEASPYRAGALRYTLVGQSAGVLIP